MRERIALAEEMITYAETVGPDATIKMPLISERSYTDKDGNPIDPAMAIPAEVKRRLTELSNLPTIGDDEDPYITKPIQKIVDDSGTLVADVSSEAKFYVQNEERKSPLVPVLVGVIVALLIVIAVLVYFLLAH
jgi:hypothetical protein